MTASTLAATPDAARRGVEVAAAQRELTSIEERMRRIEGLVADPLDDAARVLRRTLRGAKRRMRHARALKSLAATRVSHDPYTSIGLAFAAGVLAAAMVGWVSRRSAALAATASTLAELGDEPDEPVSTRP